MNKDDNKVVKLRQPSVPKARAVDAVSDVAITPRSFLTMSELEQDMFLKQLRERRLRAVEVMKQVEVAKQQANSVQAAYKLERKADQIQRQLDRINKGFEKLDELILSMRALSLQYTDVDITKTGD